jgi:hypothetical protein
MSTTNGKETNEQFIARIMSFGCPTGPLIQAFVIEALFRYSTSVMQTDAAALDSPLISGDAWKKTAEWLDEQLAEQYGRRG